jgi:hypothetical protein
LRAEQRGEQSNKVRSWQLAVGSWLTPNSPNLLLV